MKKTFCVYSSRTTDYVLENRLPLLFSPSAMNIPSSVGVGSQLTLLALCVCLEFGSTDAHQSAEVTPHPHKHDPIPFPDQEDDEFSNIDLGWDVAHIQEEIVQLGLPTEQLNNMTEGEMDFYYFKLHDFDNNTKLDGSEILKGMTHTIGRNVARVKAQPGISKDKMEKKIEKLYTVMYGMADQALEMADSDFDGYITYPEFMTAQHAHLHAEKVEVEEGNNGGSEAQEQPAPQHDEQ